MQCLIDQLTSSLSTECVHQTLGPLVISK